MSSDHSRATRESSDSERGHLFRRWGVGGDGESSRSRESSQIESLDSDDVCGGRLETGEHGEGLSISEVLDPFFSTDSSSCSDQIGKGRHSGRSGPSDTQHFP